MRRYTTLWIINARKLHCPVHWKSARLSAATWTSRRHVIWQTTTI